MQEKLDGSLIKVYYYNQQWIVATNGMIDAKEADSPSSGDKLSFYDLFIECWRCTTGKKEVDFDAVLKRDYVYMFEMMHPDSVIVVQHKEPKLCHLATRNMRKK